jgi:hypothetical protein
MFRVVIRLAVVLVVAATVAAAVYLLVPTRVGPGEERLGPRPSSFDPSSGRRRGHRFEGGDWEGARGGGHGREEASVGRGLAGGAVTAVQVGAVGAVIVFVQRRRRRAPAVKP